VDPGDAAKAEIARCASDFRHFCKYLKIVDKRGRLVPYVMNHAQERLHATVDENPWVYILKARQLGITTGIALRYFWRALFTPNHRVAVLAHRSDSAQVIFEIYKQAYDSLPEFLRFPTAKSNVRELVFFHGGLIRVMTANSEGARGTTYQALHCSEFAFWGDVEKTIAAAFQTAGPDAELLLETTANGLNGAAELYHAENGFKKVFMPWTSDPGYERKDKPRRLHPKIAELKRDFELTKRQSNWAQWALDTKCMGSWNTFLQEYPLEAEHAFITSGDHFFDQLFPHSQAIQGYKCYREPSPYRVYSIGVDVASGSPSGDFSAFCVIDVTDKKNVEVVSTHYARTPPHEFAERSRQEALKYSALVVVESNTYGLAVLEYLVSKEYAYIFRRTNYDKLGGRWIERLGFATTTSTRPVMLSRLLEFTSKQMIPINDERMKTEMNTFVYNDRGKPSASPGKHDDMIFAHALALMGLDQIEYVREEIHRRPPGGLLEMLQFESTTGKLYADETAPSQFGTEELSSSLLDAALDDSPVGR
jgi:hypothetical protein